MTDTEWIRLRTLWTYRFHKYTHILGKFWSVVRKTIYLRWLKWRAGNRPFIAIILSEQMGDVIACEPVAREVRTMYPDGYIIWFIREAYVDLVQYNPALNNYLVEKCPSERVWLLRLNTFDHVYNLHISHRKCRYCPEDPVNPTADAIGLTFDNYYDRGDLLYMFSQAAGLPALTAEPKMYIPESVRQQLAGRQLPTEPIVIHAQSSHVARDWPAQHWNRLVEWLLDTYEYPVIEIGLKSMITQSSPRYIDLCGQLSLLETAEVVRNARLFVGIDSGPAHMANAMNTTAILLLGKLFDFVEYMPYSGRYKRGEGVTILNNVGHPCAELPYDWVQQAVARQLGQPTLV